MRIIETKVFAFGELSAEAQEKARASVRAIQDFQYLHDEIRDTLSKAQTVIGFEVSRWEYGNGQCDAGRFTREPCQEIDNEPCSLQAWLESVIPTGDCPFTGVCWDENFLDGIKEAGAEDAREAIRNGVIALFSAALAEIEYRYTDEAINEEIGANGYQFLENGDLS